jgi:hypothetical protein
VARRTGWSRLSKTYRARLERNGVSRKAWEGGADLRSARGKGPRSPSHAAPAAITREAVRGDATFQAVRDELGTWRNQGPAWLPSRSWMGNDAAAALSQLTKGPSQWEHVTFTPRSGGPWLMTVEYLRGYPQTIEVPGGSGAQEIMKMLAHPDSVGIADLDEWGGWIGDDRDFDVEESA